MRREKGCNVVRVTELESIASKLRTKFSNITGDLTLKGKSINKIIIPKEEKPIILMPKVVITTNIVFDLIRKYYSI